MNHFRWQWPYGKTCNNWAQSLVHAYPYIGLKPNVISCGLGRTIRTVDMKKPKLNPQEKRLQAEVLEKTAIKLIEKSVELKSGKRSRTSKKKKLKTKAA